MQDLQLSSGDLVPSSNGFATVDGAAYLQQRIAMALQVHYGSDPYNPTWGSVLDSYLGVPQASDTAPLVSSEVSRVLAGLIAAQQLQMTASVLNGTQSQLSADDVIASVNSVSAVQSCYDPSTIQVSLALITQAGVQVTITRTVSSS
jgi:hypothetical protein